MIHHRGMNADGGLLLTEIAEHLGITRQRADQILQSAMRKMARAAAEDPGAIRELLSAVSRRRGDGECLTV